ncbi:leucine-rich repeat-containing protein 51 isoform X2 [Dromaius novaehollandiae]|uniref:leucine-rich repeat-containing protein 51 isoform X2 n=1 Tax=Dromaius novaehollandiae TaxID=8790 RepID=UPI00311D3210
MAGGGGDGGQQLDGRRSSLHNARRLPRRDARQGAPRPAVRLWKLEGGYRSPPQPPLCPAVSRPPTAFPQGSLPPLPPGSLLSTAAPPPRTLSPAPPTPLPSSLSPSRSLLCPTPGHCPLSRVTGPPQPPPSPPAASCPGHSPPRVTAPKAPSPGVTAPPQLPPPGHCPPQLPLPHGHCPPLLPPPPHCPLSGHHLPPPPSLPPPRSLRPPGRCVPFRGHCPPPPRPTVFSVDAGALPPRGARQPTRPPSRFKWLHRPPPSAHWLPAGIRQRGLASRGAGGAAQGAGLPIPAAPARGAAVPACPARGGEGRGAGCRGDGGARGAAGRGDTRGAPCAVPRVGGPWGLWGGAGIRCGAPHRRRPSGEDPRGADPAGPPAAPGAPRPHGIDMAPGSRAAPAARRPPRLLLPRRRLRPSLAGLPPALEQLLEAPERLCWLDLSFNQLPHIDPVLARYGHLRRLDLHANRIGSLAEVQALAALPRLRRLTLHGNPVEAQRGYS